MEKSPIKNKKLVSKGFLCNVSRMTVRVKICGVKTIEIASICMDAQADFIGLNFSPESKRRVDLESAFKIYNHVKKNSASLFVVGLFYKNSSAEIESIVKEIPFDFVQFVAHDETVEHDFYKGLGKNLIPQISVKESISDSDLSLYKGELIILDSYKEGMGGGSGEVFNWDNVSSVRRKYLLAGGLNPSNVEREVDVLNPFGVDVASGVESSPGVKDPKLIEEFIRNAKRI